MGAFPGIRTDVTIWNVAREIESRRGIRVAIRDPDIAARTMTAVVRGRGARRGASHHLPHGT
jgi:hypothetical protein